VGGGRRAGHLGEGVAEREITDRNLALRDRGRVRARLAAGEEGEVQRDGNGDDDPGDRPEEDPAPGRAGARAPGRRRFGRRSLL
jgi:hypothetical protein